MIFRLIDALIKMAFVGYFSSLAPRLISVKSFFSAKSLFSSGISCGNYTLWWAI